MKTFFHNDLDGKCAGAIVRQALMQGQEDGDYGFEYIPIDYKDDFPFDKIIPDEEVIIVDFSLQREGDFIKLFGITKDIIWIDHHKTAIERHKNMNLLQGIRRVANADGSLVSGCELTWEYFFPDEPVPAVVKLLGDYDTYTFQYPDTNALQAGIKLYDNSPESDYWEYWLNSKYHPVEEIDKGKIALKYRDNYYAGLIKSWSFPTTFEGYSAIACNAGAVGSQLFDSVKEDYDLLIPFVFDGKQWTVSLYTKKEGIDVSEIAKKYGGGGHVRAAGFQCKELPFNKKED